MVGDGVKRLEDMMFFWMLVLVDGGWRLAWAVRRRSVGKHSKA